MAHRNIKSSKKLPNTLPRLKVFRSLKHIYAFIINGHGAVIAAETDNAAKKYPGPKIDRARQVGRAIAEKANKLQLNRVIFNRSHYKYHGRVKALAEGAKEGGLTF